MTYARMALHILFKLIFILFLLSATSTVFIEADEAAIEQSFLQCFLLQSHASSQIFSPTTNTSSFNTIYSSSIKSFRFLSPGFTKPSFIVLPTENSHVQVAVSCGRRYGLRLRVRSGGHDYEGLSSVSYVVPFVLLDISNFRSVEVDATGSTAWVGAGATIGELAYYISLKNATVGFPAGLCSTIGVGGHFSGGGIGTLLRKYGTSADNIIDALMVDANSNLMNRQSMGEDAFWAICGGGAASFGIVLYYRIKLVYVPPTVTVFGITRTLATGANQILQRWQSVVPMLSENIWIRSVAQAINVQSGRSIQVTFQGMYLGRSGDLLSTLKNNFPELGLQAADCTEMSWIGSVLYFAGYPVQNSTKLLDRQPQSGSYFKGKSDFVRNPINATGWESIWNVLMQATDEPMNMIFEPWGGKMYTIPETAIAFPHRKGNLFNIQYFVYWVEKDAASAKKHLDWMRMFHDFLTPFVSSNPRGAYLNYRDLDLGQNQPGFTSYSKATVWGNMYYLNNFKKLAQVKARIDSGNYFWSEQSVPPYAANNFYSAK